MDNHASPGAREAFHAWRNEPILYRGHPMRRGFALLLESEISEDDLEQLAIVGSYQPLKHIQCLDDDDARLAVYADLVDIDREQASFEFPYHQRS